MSSTLDLKRCPQTLHGKVGGERRKKENSGFTLDSLFSFFWCFQEMFFHGLLFFHSTISEASISQFTGSISVLSKMFLIWYLNWQHGVLHGFLPDVRYEKRICLGRQMSGIQTRCLAYESRWLVLIVSRLSLFTQRTSLFVIWFCHMFYRIWQSFIW